MANSFERIFWGDEKNLQYLSDTLLRTQDGSVFNIHRIALARSCRYFYELFCANATSSDILIPGVKGEVLEKVLHFFYTGDIICTEDILIDFLNFSSNLSSCHLQKEMKEYIQNSISITNCVQVLLASYHNKQRDILWISFRFLQTHFEIIVSNRYSKIEELPADLFKELLLNRSLCVRSEHVIWDEIVKWVEYDEFSRQAYIPGLLLCFKVGDMGPEIVSRIAEHDISRRITFCDVIQEFMSSECAINNHQVLCDFFQFHRGLLLESEIHRLPTKIYIFISSIPTECPGKTSRDIYITYDDNTDIWRKYHHIERDDPFYIAFVGEYTCLFEKNIHPQTFRVYNIDDISRIIEPENEVLIRRQCITLKHGGLIYTLGGCVENEEGRFSLTGRVQVYDPELNMWNEAAPMTPVVLALAASLGNKIYVVGSDIKMFTREYDFMEHLTKGPLNIAQEYDPETNSWMLIEKPKTWPHHQLVSYRDRLYLTKEENKVIEIYDPAKGSWHYCPDLPFEYLEPRFKVLQDQLIVHECDEFKHAWSIPMVRWDERSECWEPIEESSSLMHLFRYDILIVEDFGTLKALKEDNIKMISSFVKCPFHQD